MKKKILFLVVHLNYGGAEVGLLTTLKNIRKDLFDYKILSIERKGPVGEEIEKAGFEVTYLNSRARLYNLALIFKIVRVLKEERPDILHTSLFYANFFGRIASLFWKPSVIITEERSMYTEKKFYHIMLDKLLSGMTDKIIVCSNSVLEFTVQQEKIGKEKFYLIYNAVDADRFSVNETKEALRRRYGFPEQGFIVGSVGSLIPKKGHNLLIEAAVDLSKNIPDFRLLIIGEGESKPFLTEMSRRYGLNNSVNFLGARSDVPQLLKAMDVFILPSFQEGFPRTIIEAMYTGLPVMASKISGIPEIISDGENGLLLPVGNSAIIVAKCLMLYNDPGLRNKIGSSAKKKIESGYLPKDYVQKLEELYAGTLRDKGYA